MDGKYFVLIIALLALVAVGGFFVFRRRTPVDIRGPFGTRLKVTGANDPAPIQPAVKYKMPPAGGVA
jgi:hypothetical protein